MLVAALAGFLAVLPMLGALRVINLGSALERNRLPGLPWTVEAELPSWAIVPNCQRAIMAFWADVVHSQALRPSRARNASSRSRVEDVLGANHQGAGRCLELLVTHLHSDRAT